MTSVYIYGLFTPDSNVCLYVGRTTDPTNRYNGHRAGKTTKGQKFVLTILKRVRERFGSREEARAIKKYKDLGQASFNTIIPNGCLDRTMTTEGAIKLLKSMKPGDSLDIHSDSDLRLLQSYASLLRQLKINNVFAVNRPKRGIRKIFCPL